MCAHSHAHDVGDRRHKALAITDLTRVRRNGDCGCAMHAAAGMQMVRKAAARKLARLHTMRAQVTQTSWLQQLQGPVALELE